MFNQCDYYWFFIGEQNHFLLLYFFCVVIDMYMSNMTFIDIILEITKRSKMIGLNNNK